MALLCPLTPQEVGLKPYGAGESEPEQKAQENTTDSGLELRVFSPTFLVLSVFSVAIVLIATLSGHMASLAQDYGYTAKLGALLLSACMVGNVLSKFVLGAIADKAGVFVAILCSMVTTALGLALILFNPGGQWALLASGFLYGTCFSIGSLGISLLTRNMYGDARYSDAYSLVSVVISVAYACGVTLAGFAFDISGSYATSLVAGLVLLALAAGCLFFLRQHMSTSKAE